MIFKTLIAAAGLAASLTAGVAVTTDGPTPPAEASTTDAQQPAVAPSGEPAAEPGARVALDLHGDASIR